VDASAVINFSSGLAGVFSVSDNTAEFVCMLSFSTCAAIETFTTGTTTSFTGKVAVGIADSVLPSGLASVLISDT
jgi:hypothetical protein